MLHATVLPIGVAMVTGSNDRLSSCIEAVSYNTGVTTLELLQRICCRCRSVNIYPYIQLRRVVLVHAYHPMHVVVQLHAG